MEIQRQENELIQSQPPENFPANPHKPDKKLIAIVIAIVVILIASVATGAYYWWQSLGSNSQQVCTMEAKLCPDGSAVGRIGPNCEFAECPEDVSAGWQTYKNEQYGFEFKYPKEWELKENNQIISFTAPANLIGKGNQLASIKPEIVINRDKGSYKNLEDFLSKWEYNDSDLSALWNISSIAYKEINGSRFFYYEYYHQVKGFVFLTIKDGDLVQIKFIDETGQDGKFLSAYGDFVKLISTFKFIEPIDTSDWQTYRNEKFKFEIKYPSGWSSEEKFDGYVYLIKRDSDLCQLWGGSMGHDLPFEFIRETKEIIIDSKNYNQILFRDEEKRLIEIEIMDFPTDDGLVLKSGGEITTDCLNALYQILTTFKFIE